MRTFLTSLFRQSAKEHRMVYEIDAAPSAPQLESSGRESLDDTVEGGMEVSINLGSIQQVMDAAKGATDAAEEDAAVAVKQMNDARSTLGINPEIIGDDENISNAELQIAGAIGGLSSDVQKAEISDYLNQVGRQGGISDSVKTSINKGLEQAGAQGGISDTVKPGINTGLEQAGKQGGVSATKNKKVQNEISATERGIEEGGENAAEEAGEITEATQDEAEESLNTTEVNYSDEMQTRMNTIKGYKGTTVGHEPGTQTYTFASEKPATLKKLSKWAEKHGMQPKIVNGVLTTQVNGFVAGFGFTGPGVDVEVKVAGQEDAGEETAEGSKTETGNTVASASGTETTEDAEEGVEDASEEVKEEPANAADTEKKLQETEDELTKQEAEGKEREEDDENGVDAKESDIKKVEELQESEEEEKERRSRLMREARDAEPKMKTAKELKTEKTEALNEKKADINKAIDSTRDAVGAQRTKLESTKNAIADLQKDGDPNGAISTLKEVEAEETADLQRLEENQKTLESNLKTMEDELKKDTSMIDKMNEYADELADRSNKKFTEMGDKLLNLDEKDIGTIAKDISVKNDESFGLTMDVKDTQKLVDKFDSILSPEQEDELRSNNNPSIALNAIASTLKSVEERKAQ